MGKSVNTMMFTSSSEFVHEYYKFCEKCGVPFIEDTVDNMPDRFDSLTGELKKTRYWGCPNYTGKIPADHDYRLYTGDIPTPVTPPTTIVKRSLKDFIIGKSKDA